jgi:creatinine amidohydrolase
MPDAVTVLDVSVLWNELTAVELRALAQRDAVVIVPVGSTEQHGPHLPVEVDSLIATEIAVRGARLAAAETLVVVAPTVWAGLAEHHFCFGGTLSLDFATFFGVLRCVARSLDKQGFRRVLLLNAHGGNENGLKGAVDEITRETGLPLATVSYWSLIEDEFAEILEKQATVLHACEAETSMMRALRPDLVRTGLLDGAAECGTLPQGLAYRWLSITALTSNGVVGSPAAASADKGERLLAAAAMALHRLVLARSTWPAMQSAGRDGEE